MAVEAIDARHEAMLCLHRAILEIEQSDLHEAARLAHAAIAWMRDVTDCIPKRSQSVVSGLQDHDVRESSDGWTYRP